MRTAHSMRRQADPIEIGGPPRALRAETGDAGRHAEPAASAALLRTILDGSSDAVYVRDSSGRHVLCNPRAARLLGLATAELVGRHDWEVFPADVAYRLRELDRQVISSGEPATLEISLPLPGGRCTYLEATLLAGDLGGGADRGVVMIARDVTRERQADEALTLRERQLADAQRIARLGSWEWDLEHDRVTWKDPMFNGCGMDEAPGPLSLEQCLEHVHPGDRDRTRDILEHAAASGIPVEFEHRIPRADGGEGVMLCRGVVVRDDDDRPVRMFGTSQDITGHREAERSLRAAMAEAERASEAKSDFLSRMSHELRTPLNAILGFGQVMAADPALNDRESVEEILSAGQHLLEMINDILDLSRIEAGRVALSLEPVALSLALRESCEMVRRSAEQANVTMHTAPVCAGQRFLMADARRLKQVLINLLSNAIKYNRRGGSVEVLCSERAGDRLRLEVRDTGIGMDAGQLSGLFSPFERGGAERTSIEGTGLGLALSKRLVEAMGGELGVSSTPGEGSTFWFELPLAPSPQVPQQRTAEPELPSTGSGERLRRVLYVEDSRANLRLIQRLFDRRPDLELLTGISGEQGLSVARAQRPDLILLDVQLPDMNGDEVLWRLQQDPELRDVPVVAVSGDATPRQIQRLLDLGARDYLTKPLDLAELLKIVDELLAPEDAPLHIGERHA